MRDTTTSGVITLLTDFGTADGYVAAMKGVILSRNPRAVLVDVTHEVGPQDVRGAAFVLHTVHRYFPPRTVHLVVVDPGVGTERAGLILDTGQALYVGPDNGLFSFLLAEERERSGQEVGLREIAHISIVEVPPHWRAVLIAESSFWLPEPSNTFHGRDIFAPVAAHLSLGEPVERFGPRLDTLRAFDVPVARKLPDGGVEGAVLHVDRFGNLITSIRGDELPRGSFTTEVAGRHIEGISRTYADGSGLIVLVGSSGYLEVALSGGSAASATGLGVGSPVRVIPVPRHRRPA